MQLIDSICLEFILNIYPTRKKQTKICQIFNITPLTSVHSARTKLLELLHWLFSRRWEQKIVSTPNAFYRLQYMIKILNLFWIVQIYILIILLTSVHIARTKLLELLHWLFSRRWEQKIMSTTNAFWWLFVWNLFWTFIPPDQTNKDM